MKGVIFRYLKKFWVILLICFALLFGQAMADLFLPNYMSDIVNVGIQQGGIERSVPEAISRDGFDFLKQFLSAEDAAALDAGFEPLATGGAGAEYDALAAKYPLLATGDILVLKSSADASGLDACFGRAAFIMINWLQSDFVAGLTQPGQETTLSADLDLAQVYLPLTTLVGAYLMAGNDFSALQAQAAQVEPVMLNSMGASFARMLYKELGMDVNKIQSDFILMRGLIMLLISLAGGAASIMVGFFSSRMAAKFSKRVREDLFNKVQSFSSNEFDKFSTASLITRTTNDITQIQIAIIMGVRMLCYAPILGVGAVVMALSKSVNMGWIVALACVVLISILAGILLVALPKFKIMQKLIDRVNLVARENLSGLLVVRAFGTQKHEEGRFGAANKDLTGTMLFLNRVMAILMPVLMLIMNVLVVLIIWVGAHHVAESSMQVGDMMAFMQYAILIVMAVLMVAAIFTMIPRALVSSKRIAEVLNTAVSINDPQIPCEFVPEKRGEVEFKNVSFKYEGAEENVLSDISFIAPAGKTTAIIGSTGSGKSTLINLIPRFYDVTEGAILVNGTDVREVRQQQLRQEIGYVPQKGMLLSGTVESNLKYGRRDADDNVLNNAVKTAQAAEFVNKLPDKTNATVAAGGTNFSGGQKQRLSIARALVKESPIYIFDDSFSALDYKTDAKLREALKANQKNSTVLIVAQRVATIRDADQIIVLDKGKIAGIGTHKQLLSKSKIYKEIALSQLNKEEL